MEMPCKCSDRMNDFDIRKDHLGIRKSINANIRIIFNKLIPRHILKKYIKSHM